MSWAASVSLGTSPLGQTRPAWVKSTDLNQGGALGVGGRWLALAGLLGVFGLGCVPPSALPVRGVLAGAPGRLAAGELELSGGVIGFMDGQPPWVSAPLVGGGWVATALTERLSVELGGFAVPLGRGAGFGFLGARWTGAVHSTSQGTLFADVDVGLGAGGTYCTPDNCPGSRSPRVFELGGTQGGAVGYTVGPLSVYARVKLEEGKTALGHLVLWPAGVLGVELRIGHVLSLGVASGAFSLAELGRPFGFAPLYQLQVTLFLDAPWRAAPTTSATAR